MREQRKMKSEKGTAISMITVELDNEYIDVYKRQGYDDVMRFETGLGKREDMKTAFDVDTGVDDSLALLYALNKPRFEIVGIATVTGNVEADLAAENTLKILDLAGAPEIPVTLGALAPLRGRWEGRVSVIHGDNGLGNVKLPASGRKTTGKGVEEHYLELGERCQGELVLIALGPLTNIATDPEAADLVFQSGMDITAVGLDVTTKVRLKRSHMDWLEAHCKPCLLYTSRCV